VSVLIKRILAALNEPWYAARMPKTVIRRLIIPAEQA
jgi:hypothetical protein